MCVISTMTREWFGNDSVYSRFSLGSNLSRFSLASLICLCVLTVGVGNVWGKKKKKITSSNISANLSNGDIVILATESAGAPSIGVSGGTVNNTNKTTKTDATTSTTEASWMEFTVTGRSTIKDDWDEDIEVFCLKNSSNQYVGQPGANTFFLTTVEENKGVFYPSTNGYLYTQGADSYERQLCKYVNQGTYYRFYKSSSYGSGYTAFYIWKKASSSFTVTYDGNEKTSGSVPTDATAYNSGATVTVKGNTGNLARTGYSFGGWNTKANGSGTNYTAGSGTFTITANTTLYAKWNPNQYTVTWVVNGSTVRTDSNVNHGSSVTPPTVNPLPCGDKLMGWTDAAGGAYVHGTSNLYTGATISITRDVVLYAVFADEE